MRRLVSIGLTIVLVGHLGCAPRYYQLPPPVSEEIRAELGTTGVVSARFTPQIVKISGILKRTAPGAAVGTASAGGALATSSGPIAVGGMVGVPYVAITLALVAVAVTPVVIYKAATAVPADKVEKMEAVLNSAIAEIKMQEALRNRVFLEALHQTGLNLVLPDEEGPISFDEMADYVKLSERGIHSVLEVSVLAFGFEGKERHDPLLALAVLTRVRLVRTSDNSKPYESLVAYGGASKRYSEWLEDDGRLFRDELDQAYQGLAEKTVEEVFLLYDLPLNPAPTWWPK